ncbi:putative nitrate transporter NarT [compost metagenome]|uniref:nitrate/nitrite transporter n=1 Tax=Paenibacillus sp. 1182 TaxID=2806565 RepID=UPI000F978CDA|nr:nitrate/nitrite transporter [Paenibacillus sp. 1182]
MVKKIQLPLQTLSLVVSFMAWVLISSLISYISQDIPLTPGQRAWSTAIPVILGSLLRIPAGILTNRFGARLMNTVSFLILLVPVYYLSQANTFLDLAVGGFFLGIGGATFSIGVTSLPQYYPKEKQGTINGIYGIGNLGTAISTFGAPWVADAIGWSRALQLFLILLALFALLNLFLGDKREERVRSSWKNQLKQVYRNEKLWFFSIFYFITFGSFVAFTIYLPSFLVSYFELSKVDAGLRTAGFIALATFLRPVGGILSDKSNPFVVLMFVFAGLTLSGVLLSFGLTMPLFTLGCLMVAVCAGIGNGAVFKLVPLYFSKQGGIASGIVSAAGGLGGFFPPLLLTLLFGWTGHYAIGFMALSEASLASLILVLWVFFSNKLEFASDIIKSTADAVMVTDAKGVIHTVNAAFTEVTGYPKEAVIGKTPNILSSGFQDRSFYNAFWDTLLTTGKWQGKIVNRKASGEVFREWLSVTAITNEQNVTHYVAIFNDLSLADSVIGEGEGGGLARNHFSKKATGKEAGDSCQDPH